MPLFLHRQKSCFLMILAKSCFSVRLCCWLVVSLPSHQHSRSYGVGIPIYSHASSDRLEKLRVAGNCAPSLQGERITSATQRFPTELSLTCGHPVDLSYLSSLSRETLRPPCCFPAAPTVLTLSDNFFSV